MSKAGKENLDAPTSAKLAKEDEEIVKLAIKDQARRRAVRKKQESKDRKRRRQRRKKARDTKRKVEDAKAASEKVREQHQSKAQPKKRLTMLERQMKKRYGLYENGVGEFMHKDERNARPIAKLLDILVERIHRRQRGTSRVESFKLFLPTSGGGKITKGSLAHGIAACGCSFTPEECTRVFRQVDKNGDGNIDFQEFVTVLMGDKPQMLRNVSSDVMNKLTSAQKRSLALLRHMGQDGKGNRWAINDAKKILAQKIQQKVAGGSGQVRHAFRLFQDSLDKSGVTFGSFCHGLRSVGMIVPEDMQWALYSAFDANGDGVISYSEFHSAFHELAQKPELSSSSSRTRSGVGSKAGSIADPVPPSRRSENSQRSMQSQITLNHIQQLGLLRPRTAAHHRARVTKGLPGVKKPYKKPTIVNKPARHRWQDKLNRRWDLHASNKYVHRSQPFSERLL